MRTNNLDTVEWVSLRRNRLCSVYRNKAHPVADFGPINSVFADAFADGGVKKTMMDSKGSAYVQSKK